MSSKDILELCLGNLLRRKTRTVLAVIGVIVGVCAIVVMVSIGFGLSENFTAEIESYGNLHMINVYNYGGGGERTSSGKTYNLNDSTISKMEKIDGATAVTPLVSQYVTFGIGHEKNMASLVGIRPEFLEKMNIKLERGRIFNDNDKAPLLFGYNTALWFYNPRTGGERDWTKTEPTVDVITKNIIITGDWNWGTNKQGEGEYTYEEIEAEGVGLIQGTDNDYAYNVYTSLDFIQKVRESIAKSEKTNMSPSAQQNYEQAWVYVADIDKVAAVSKTIKEEYGFQTFSLQDILEEMNSIAKMIELVLGGIGAVSLLVAAIGIANTMIMSVYERTREIGVMKVIGASLSDIRKMFLLEAGMIGFGGGLVGVGLSFLLAWVGNKFVLPMISGSLGLEGGRLFVIPWWLALGALVFATFVGIISGYYPAQRAMNLSALEGLKNE